MSLFAVDDALPATADPVQELASTDFKIPYLFPYQRYVIASIMDRAADSEPDAVSIVRSMEAEAGDDLDCQPPRLMVLLPTGAGKSICFQLPSAVLTGLSVFVFPLLGLMRDQERRLRELGHATVLLQGGLSKEDFAERLSLLRSGRVKTLITNPETLNNQRTLNALSKLSVSLLVIDEAHCISEWGDSFRPAYLGLGVAVRQLNPNTVCAFTATASEHIRKRIAEVLFANLPYTLVAGDPDRPNIRFEIRRSLSTERLLRQTLRSCAKPALVFVPSRAGAEITALGLHLAFPELEVKFYHAGLAAAEKRSVEDWFLSAKNAVLCSTCAYGMGMDKPDIRTVIHVAAPGSIEAYLQEAGRAGRDGKPATAILLAGMAKGADLAAGETMFTGSSADPLRQAQERQAAMRAYRDQDRHCRRRILLASLGKTELACNGCDVCSGHHSFVHAELEGIWQCVRHNQRRFDPESLSACLRGEAGWPGAYGFASFGDWEREDLKEALAGAFKLGRISLLRRGFWKGRIQTRQSESAPE